MSNLTVNCLEHSPMLPCKSIMNSVPTDSYKALTVISTTKSNELISVDILFYYYFISVKTCNLVYLPKQNKILLNPIGIHSSSPKACRRILKV